jgi:HlyD family secretion protein
MNRLVVLLLALVAAVALVGGGLAATGNGPFAGMVAGATPSPSIGPVPAPDSVVSDGEVIPVRSVDLAPAGGGRVTTVAAEGSQVRAGDVVLAIDPTQADAAIGVATAAVPIAEAQAAQAASAASQARGALTVAKYTREQAHATWDAAGATRDALPSGASKATKRAADANTRAAKAAYQAADAQWKAARVAVTTADDAAKAATAEVVRANAGVAQARAARAQLDVTAPFAGVVAFAGPSAGEVATPGVVAIRIADVSAWRVQTTNMDETGVARFHLGSAVEVTLDAYPGRTFAGVVREIGAYGQTVQGNIVYRVLVETTDPLPSDVRWNMTASVTVATK